MKTIGLVGGVASGKSLAAKYLVDLGAVHLDADRTGHDVLAEDTEVRQAIVGRWGDSILATDKTIDRTAIARRVFAQTKAGQADRKFLEELLHPRIGERLRGRRAEAAAAGKPAVVLDAPVLLEAGWKKLCDVVLMIDAPRHLRLARAKTRGWTDAEFDRREASQWPIDRKRQASDVVVENNGTAESLQRALATFWAQNISPLKK